MRVFVDTSALLTLLDRADPRHDRARLTFSDLAEETLVTHGYVVAESLAVARRRFGVDGVVAILDDLLPALEVLEVEVSLHVTAQTRYRSSLPSGISFVDQVSFAVMEREGISTAFAFDADFTRPGFSVIPTT